MAGQVSSMRSRRRLLSARSAIVLGVLVFVLTIAGLVLVVSASQPEGQLIRLMTIVPVAAIGTLVASRRPGNPLGWLMLGAGLFFAVNDGAGAYSVLDYRLHHGALPLGRLALALQPTWAGGLVMITSCLWLFPDGHLPSGRRRRVGEILFAVGLLYAALPFVPWVLAASARTLHLDADGTPAVLDHPVGWWLVWGAIENIGFFAILLSWVVWVAVQVPSYRKSSGERRLQLKWLYGGAVAFIVSLTVTVLEPGYPTPQWQVITAVAATGLAALPIALGIGILKYRLYDIDRVISRTLAYAIVTALLAGIYAGLVLLATQVFRFSSPVAIAAATLAAAALFSPVRRRVQRGVDRRFNRARYDADQTVAAFAAQLKDAVDLDAVQADLACAVQHTLEPAHISVWISHRD
jgi:hypothetical protein